MRRLENAALALHLPEVLFAAAIGHVLAEDDDVRIAPHLLRQREVDLVHHGARIAGKLRRCGEGIRRGIDRARVEMQQGRAAGGRGGVQSGLGGRLDFEVDLVHQRLQRVAVENALRDQPFRELRHRVPRRFCGSLPGGLVQPLLVRERVRVGPDAGRMNQRGACSRAAVAGGFDHGTIGRDEIAAIGFDDPQTRKTRHQPGDVPACGLRLHRHRDGVAVVLDYEHDGQAPQARRVQRLPELALAGRALAAGDQHGGIACGIEVAVRLRAADGLQELRAGGRGPAHDVQLRRAPMRRHLAAAGCDIGARAHGRQQHLCRRDAQRQAQRAVAVIGIEPVLPAPESHARGGRDGFVARAADLEENAVLALQQDLAVVQAAGRVHHPEGPNQRVRIEPPVTDGKVGGNLRPGTRGHAAGVLPVQVYPRRPAAVAPPLAPSRPADVRCR